MTSCWIVTEGIAGTENQCLGVAEALDIIPVIKRINLRQPWRLLSPYLGLECACTFTGDPLTPPWPDLVLCSGRKSIAAARYIKTASGGKSFVVQIQDPRINSPAFDLVAVPVHDPARGDNVITTVAAPNRVNGERLEDAHHEFSHLGDLPSPRVAVLIGGTSKAYKMSADMTQKLADQLTTLARKGYGLMVTASRRTGKQNLHILQKALTDENVYFWNGGGANPYFGFLAWADFILVTADSVSMLSEAASTGKPVYMIPLEGGSRRLDQFHQNLLQQGIIKTFEGTLSAYDYSSLNDAGKIAAEIRKRLKK